MSGSSEVRSGSIILAGGGLVIGGTVPNTPLRYNRAILILLEAMTSESWQAWWNVAGTAPNCELYYWIGGKARARTYIRKKGNLIRATIERSVTLGDPLDPGKMAALDDALELARKLQARFSLPPHPSFPSIEELSNGC